MNTKTSAADRSSRSNHLAVTAAVLCVLAGAPAGLAQSSVEEPGAGLGSLMSLFGQGKGETTGGQPEAEDQFRTDGLYYDDSMTVELHVQDEALIDVLQMLSLQSERNIVAGNDVNARITANLYGVTFHEALDAILHVNGYGYVEDGNFIYVYPADVLDTIADAARQVEGHVFHLSYLSAVDAADFVTPLLSESGEIKSNGKVANWSEPKGPTGDEQFAAESTLIVYDFAENIESIGKMLAQLDTRPEQILVEATIVQTSLTEDNAFGVDFSIIADFDYGAFTSPLNAVDSLVRGTTSDGRVPSDGGATALVGTPGNISGPGTFKAGVVSNDVAVFLRMLNQISTTTVISNPKVVTLNRQPGRVLVGRKVGYLQTTATDTSTTQSVEFLDTGTQLNFRPFVMGDGVIRMELKPQVSEAQLRSATDALGAAVTIPDEITNELVANVMVPDGHTIVLGGLFREATTTSRRQVPVLGDIPILGTAFRGHEDGVERQEIIFMITPSLLSDQTLVAQGLRGEEVVHQVRAGAREGTLPFGQVRQAAQLLVEAEQLAAKGETDAALHKVRRVLHLDPTNTQAIALREELVNKRDNWPSNSILEDIVKGAAEVRSQHNILQHGWKGDMADAGTSDSAAGQPNRAVANRSAPSPQCGQRPARTQPGSGSHASTEEQAFNPSYDLSSWWSSPEFDMFMTGWAATWGAAHNQVFDPADRWWISGDFRRAIGSYRPAAGESIASWWNSAEFGRFLSGRPEATAAFDQVEPWWTTVEFQESVSALAEAAQGERSAAWRQTSEFQKLTIAWALAAAKARADGHPDTWWQSREFQGSVAAWAAAAGPSPEAGNQDWWNTPEFAQFMQGWAEAIAADSSTPGDDAWWNTAEFGRFMNEWAAAIAKDQAEMGVVDWWSSPEFAEFMAEWAEAIASDQIDAGKTAWWNTPEFEMFMIGWADSVAKARAPGTRAGGWWKSTDFNGAVQNRPHRTPSENHYTNVPTENQD